MKGAMIFTVIVILVLGIISGAETEEHEYGRIVPRARRSEVIDPLAPAGVVGKRMPQSSVDEARHSLDGDHTMKSVYNPAPTLRLSIGSSSPDSGVTISVNPNDTANQGAGASKFDRNYNAGSSVKVTAPATAGGNSFKRWQLDGYQWDTASTTTVTMDSDHDSTLITVRKNDRFAPQSTKSARRDRL